MEDRENILLSQLKCYYDRPLRRTLVRSFIIQQDLTLLSLSKGEGRCFITNPNFLTTISTISLYSTFSETPINIGVAEKRGLCADGPDENRDREEAFSFHPKQWRSFLSFQHVDHFIYILFPCFFSFQIVEIAVNFLLPGW
jgi:hypothetical protein